MGVFPHLLPRAGFERLQRSSGKRGSGVPRSCLGETPHVGVVTWGRDCAKPMKLGQLPSASSVSWRSGSRVTGRSILSIGTVAGMMAGFVLAAVLAAHGWISRDGTFWDAPMAIWAWVAGIQHFGAPANHPWPIVLGLLVHVAVSAVAGVAFAAVAFASQLRGHLVAGVGFGLGVWVYTRYLILPLAVEGDILFTSGVVAPHWLWWIAHGLFGAALGGTIDLWSGMQRKPPVVRALSLKPHGVDRAA